MAGSGARVQTSSSRMPVDLRGSGGALDHDVGALGVGAGRSDLYEGGEEESARHH